MANVKDRMGIAQDERLPAVTAAEDMKLPDGRNLKEVVLAMNGKPFHFQFSVPINGKVRKSSVAANNWDHLCSRLGPMFAVTRVHGGDITPLGIVEL